MVFAPGCILKGEASIRRHSEGNGLIKYHGHEVYQSSVALGVSFAAKSSRQLQDYIFNIRSTLAKKTIICPGVWPYKSGVGSRCFALPRARGDLLVRFIYEVIDCSLTHSIYMSIAR